MSIIKKEGIKKVLKGLGLKGNITDLRVLGLKGEVKKITNFNIKRSRLENKIDLRIKEKKVKILD